VVLLNQAFFPDVVATAQMSKDLADELVRRGHRVTAVASRSIYGQSGAVLPRRESIPVAREDGTPAGAIEARRVGASLFGKSSIAARIADFALFYALAAGRVLTLPRPDVVISFTTPPFIAAAGLLARLFRGSRAVHWVMDLYPDLPIACGVMKPRALSTRFFESVNRFLLRRSDLNVVLGRCMHERVLAKGTPPTRVEMIPVWSDLAGLRPIEPAANRFRREWNLGDAFVVMYSGNLGLGHDATTLCDAMERLKDRADIRFVFVGGGKRRQEVERFLREHGLTNAQYREYVPRDRLGESLALGDLHLISLKEGVEGIMVPSKLFGIMAVGRPSLFIGHPGSEIARVLAECDAGWTIREGDGEGLARAISNLAEDHARRSRLGANAAAAIVGKYDARTACARWAATIERVAARDPGHSS
jgi:glycosyltransferase involved in cell wall biosynthesis